MAIKEAARYWQHWLIGKEFTVYTDHKPLKNMNIKARTDEELGDLTYYLSQYNFKVKYNPGKLNQEADCLSKNPVLESFENEEEIIKVVNLINLQQIINDQRKNADIQNNRKNTRKKIEFFTKHHQQENIKY